MSTSFRLIRPGELDSTLVDAWRNIQSQNPSLASPYFCPEFTQLVATVRDDVWVVVIEDGSRPIGFFPHQRSLLGVGKPVGGPLSDFHGVIAQAGTEWNIDELMRAARLTVWVFDHLVDPAEKFGPYITARTASPQIDLTAGYARYARSRRDAGSDYIKKTEGLSRKLARDAGEVRFTFHEPRSRVIEQLIEWKRNQYQRTSVPDVFRAKWTRELLNRLANTETIGFAGVCSALHVGDNLLAVHIGMRSKTVFHYWFPAYNVAFATFSPGMILLLRIAQELPTIGVDMIDLGKGEAQYKQRLMTGATRLQEGAVELPSLASYVRRLRRVAEANETRGGMAKMLSLPLRVVRWIERTRRFG